MTHDELLICVNMNAQTTGGLEQNTEALRAVVELHKPLEGTNTCHQFCDTNYDTNKCETIEAIEKELK